MIKKLPLNALRIDAETQSRVAIDEAVVTDYAEAIASGIRLPPIDVFHDGIAYYVADGYHRYFAYKRNKTAIVDIEMHEGTADDARWYASGANKAHGLRRTNADKRHAVEMALKLRPDASDRAIADHCGVSNMLVAEVRKGDGQLKELSVVKRTGKDGKTRQPPGVPRAASASKPSEDTPAPAPTQQTPSTTRFQAAAAIAVAQHASNGGTPLYKDCEGRDVPADLNLVWEGREFMESLAESVRDVRLAIEEGDKSGDKALQRIGATVLANLQRCERDIRDAMPYALCPVCQGVGCKVCLQTGFVSKLVWDTAIKDEFKR